MQMCLFMDIFGIKMFHLNFLTKFNDRVFLITLYTSGILPVLKFVGVLHSAILVASPCGHLVFQKLLDKVFPAQINILTIST